jgi:hypothetical protein
MVMPISSTRSIIITLRLSPVATAKGLLAQVFQRPGDLQLKQPGAEQASRRRHAGQPRQNGGLGAEHGRPAHEQAHHRGNAQANAPARWHGLAPTAPSLQPFADHQALVKVLVARLAFAHCAIERLGRGNFLARRLGAHRHVADVPAVADHGRGVGAHPIVVAVLAPVLHQRGPGLAALERGPHVREGRGRHVGVAHQVVRLADELFAAEAARFDERLVAVSDVALGVGGRHQRHMLGEFELAPGDGLIDSHRGS